MEALLWSLKQVNKNSKIEIGAVVIDSCNSSEKVVKDLSNFLSGRLPASLKKKVGNNFLHSVHCANAINIH